MTWTDLWRLITNRQWSLIKQSDVRCPWVSADDAAPAPACPCLALLCYAGTQTEKMRKGKGLLKSKEGTGASLDDSDDWGVASMWKSRPITALKPPMLGATLVGVAEVSLVDTIQAQQQRQREKQQRVKQRRQSTLASGANAVISGGGAAEDAERERELEQSAQWYPLRRWEGNKVRSAERCCCCQRVATHATLLQISQPGGVMVLRGTPVQSIACSAMRTALGALPRTLLCDGLG